MSNATRMGGLQALLVVASGLTAGIAVAGGLDFDNAFLPRTINSSTIPANGDVNPYGVAFVPDGFTAGGTITSGDVLVSNFNNSNNLQGTGTTIIKLHPKGSLAPPGMAATFFSSSLPGLSTALGVLRAGFVIVGNVPKMAIGWRHGAILSCLMDPGI
jgi:hypothetical protein